MKQLILFLLCLSTWTAQAKIYNVKDYGAKADGTTIDTPAINRAIEEAASQGGGTIYFPAGEYACYSIRLASHIHLYIEQGAQIVGAFPSATEGYDLAEPNEHTQFQDFGHSHWKNSLIWGIGLEDITISGPGLIYGKGLTREESRLPGVGNKAISLKLCKNVTLKDFSLLHCGHFGLLATGVDNLSILNVKVDTNRDGFDIDCCKNVRISHCTVNAPWDDAIVLKASYGLGYFKDTENVTISDCFVSGYDRGSVLDLKKKSKKGLVAIVIIVLIVLAGGAVFAYKMQADKKELADFSQKVAAFQSEKLDGRDFGSHQSYFTDFMKECQDAIDAGDLKKMEELDKKWSEVENTYTTVSNGKTSLDAFASGIDQALSTYSITDDYKATYETLKKDVEAAQKDCDYEKVSDFQKQLDALATNLKSDNLKVIQNLKNDISSVSLDKDYVSADDQKKLDAYSTEVEKYIKEENYAQAVTTLNSWKTDVTALKKTIDDKKAAEQAKAESEAESKRAAESKAAESKAAESKAAESKKNQTTETKKDSSKNNSSSSNSSASSDYVLPGSSSQYLSASDVKNLSSYQLMIARNEIYARHHRKFDSADLQIYFDKKSWYSGTIEPSDFDEKNELSQIEKKNIDLIKKYE